MTGYAGNVIACIKTSATSISELLLRVSPQLNFGRQ
jgi:hypothetical protein